VTGPPTLVGSQTCAVTFQGQIGCFDANSGRALWQTAFSSTSGLAQDDRTVVAADDWSVVSAFDVNTGSRLWKNDQLKSRDLGVPFLLGRAAVLGDYQGYVHFLSASDGSLVAQHDIKFPNVPAVQWPLHVPGGFRADLQGAFSVLPFIVPQVDSDGNDIGGIRLPEQAVPLGTYTDWSFRSEQTGAPDTLVAMAGSYIPFAKTRSDRDKSHDPRLSVEERYGSRAEYVHRVEATAQKLVQERYLLQEDVAPIVAAAGQHWDWTMAPAAVNQSRK